MGNDREIEVYKTLRTSQDKYTYFLLAAAGAAIAFAVNQTQGASMAWSQFPLAAAIVSLGMSFFFGCRHINYVASTLYANIELLKVQSGQHSKVGTHQQLMAVASEGLMQAMEANTQRANRFGFWQFKLLVTGASLYVIWHVLEMYLRIVA